MDCFLRFYCLILIYYVTTTIVVLGNDETETTTTKKYKKKNRTTYETMTKVSEYGWDVWCKLQTNGYNCLGEGTHIGHYYDVKMQDCKMGTFGKCIHNYNQFTSRKDCRANCREDGMHPINYNMSAAVICYLQHDFGDCNEYHPMFYYDVTYRRCRGFSYSGCGGNHNRFHTTQQCSATCTPVVQYVLD